MSIDKVIEAESQRFADEFDADLAAKRLKSPSMGSVAHAWMAYMEDIRLPSNAGVTVASTQATKQQNETMKKDILRKDGTARGYSSTSFDDIQEDCWIVVSKSQHCSNRTLRVIYRHDNIVMVSEDSDGRKYCVTREDLSESRFLVFFYEKEPKESDPDLSRQQVKPRCFFDFFKRFSSAE